MVFPKKPIIFLMLIALAAAMLGCWASLRSSEAVNDSPITTEENVPLETQIGAAIETAQNGGRIFLELTEAQLTSAAAEELSKQGDSGVQNLSIGLDDGIMKITGDVEQNGIELPLTILLHINVDPQGQPHAEIVSGKVGFFPLPENLMAQIQTEFDQILQAQLAASSGNLFVESVGIDNGKLTIVAQPR